VVSRLHEAKLFALRHHLGQVRKGSGEAYAHHPLRVGDYIWNNFRLADEAIAGYLHDCIEDTEVTFEMIQEQFGPTIAHLVQELTSIKEDMKHFGNKGEYLLDKMEAMSNSALLVKFIDRMDSISDLDDEELKPSFVKRYMKETEYILNNIVFNVEERRRDSDLSDALIRTYYTLVSKFVDIRRKVDGKDNIKT
jgi:(p)ppGpp synthase/HD superfamily hydrolase